MRRTNFIQLGPWLASHTRQSLRHRIGQKPFSRRLGTGDSRAASADTTLVGEILCDKARRADHAALPDTTTCEQMKAKSPTLAWCPM